MVRSTSIPAGLAPLLLVATAGAELTFTTLSAEDLVQNHFLDPTSSIEVQNIESSDRSCFALSQNDMGEAGVALATGPAFGLDAAMRSNGQGSEDTGEPDLESQLPAGSEVFDPCYIQFEFRCSTEPSENDSTYTVNLEYAFGSEEYLGTATHHDDIFGVFLNGENIALIPDGEGLSPVSVGSINSEQLEYDQQMGRVKFAKLRTSATAPDGWNSIKLVIGDVDDASLDSWVLLEAGSFSCVDVSAPVVSPPLRTDSTDPSGNANTGTDRKFSMPMPIAVGLLVIVGILALSLPVIGLTFYNKRMN